MRIAMIPRYTRHAASSRLRVYAIAEAIQRLGLAEVQVADTRVPQPHPDVLVLQKSNMANVIYHADNSPCSRRIYDVDDDVLGGEGKRLVYKYCHAITTDTELRAAGIREWFCGPVHVIPDPIDYEDGPPKPPAEDAHDGVVWFGNWPNFESVRAEMLHYQQSGYRIGAISDLSPERAKMPGLELIPWTFDSFPAELRKWSRCVLSHKGADQCKSENKLVAAIYQGVMPAYVCGPAYEALLAKLLPLRDMAAAQVYVWENYRADVIARRAMEVYAG